MNIRLVAVGQKMPSWVEVGFSEYQKRLNHSVKLLLEEVPLANRNRYPDASAAKAQEAKKINHVIKPNDHVVALEVTGKSWSSEQLAEQLSRWQHLGCDVALLVGGPDGLDSHCLTRAQQQWSLSSLTLPHPLVRIMIAEQLYRAWSMLNNHPYHRC